MDDIFSNLENSETKKNFSLFEILLQMRNKEIDLFWQRNNYFLALNSAFALSVTLKLDSSNILVIIIPFFGILISFLWWRVALGSRFWQAYWSQKLREMESNISPKRFFNRNREESQATVKCYLKTNPIKGILRNFIYGQVLKGFSTTWQMILLPIVFLLFYVLMLVFSLLKLFNLWSFKCCV
jgi:hypothetical protein